MTEYQNIFSERLRELINNQRYTQVQIGEKVGVKPQAVNDWLGGRSYPAVATLIQLADFLSCSIDWLLGRSDNPKVSKPIKPEAAPLTRRPLKLISKPPDES